ncbi:hypothetical protein SNE40_000939 [Patella caerulea]|uniref:RNA helicase n=1 Tax=Patella caerulea TaxID=87958 RepID=A0AAN8KMI2_PATCE
MGLREELLRGIYAYGFEKPSAIQQRAIIPCIKGNDVIVRSPAGMGKTIVHSVACLQKLDLEDVKPQVLVMVPTRELAIATRKVIESVGTYIKPICHACVGGTRVRDDQIQLDNGVHVVVGTPGRSYSMIERNFLRTNNIKLFVLDEADELISKGFKDQIYDIFSNMPTEIQVILLTSTMPTELLEVINKIMKKPIHIRFKNEHTLHPLEKFRHFYISTESEEWKLDTLCDLYETLTITQAVIFCNTRRKVDWLTEKMTHRDFTVSAMHGNTNGKECDKIMREFQGGSTRILIVTDDLNQSIVFTHVRLLINYDLPVKEKYLCRLSHIRCKTGNQIAVNFVIGDDNCVLRDIESFYNTSIEELPMNFADLL